MAGHGFRSKTCKFFRDGIEILFWFYVLVGLCPTDILADPPNFLPSAIGDPSGCLATLMPSSLGCMLLVPLPPHPVRGLALELRFSVFSALNLCQCCESD